MSVEIIPVIDIMGGIVVHAQGQSRSDYKPLKSVLTKHHEPIAVISDLLKLHQFTTLYLADLDAIIEGKFNYDLYRKITQSFPNLKLWLDAGINSDDYCEYCMSIGIKPVIGSESLIDLALLHKWKDVILSLDFKQGQLLGVLSLFDNMSLWPKNIIVMNLDYVGESKGPDITLLSKIQQLKNDSELIAAGGVRSWDDIALLEQQNIKYALVATALHKGKMLFK